MQSLDNECSFLPKPRLLAALLAATLATGAHAQSQTDPVSLLRHELDLMRAEQARANARITELEAALTKVAQAQPTSAAVAVATPQLAATAPSPKIASPSRLTLSGDIRVRYETNFGARNTPDRSRGVMRARLRGAYALNDWLNVGAQLVTGDPNDPNTTDVTLTRFNDKLSVSLDQMYLRAKFGNLQIDAGKIVLPFTKTEMVWDGDVAPQGISAAFQVPLGADTRLKASGLYFLIDEAVAGRDSAMLGAQLALDFPLHNDLKIELAAGYYDYRLNSLAGGDAGDFRTNRFRNGRYLSDFNLLDLFGAMTWQGLGPKWPVRLVGNYVKNLGAADGEDSGYTVEVALGRTGKAHDWRIGYGYAQTDVDAVLAAFSNDNDDSSIATNYFQHALSVDYTVNPHLIVTATGYRYRPKNPLFAGASDPAIWLNRVRFNALVSF